MYRKIVESKTETLYVKCNFYVPVTNGNTLITPTINISLLIKFHYIVHHNYIVSRIKYFEIKTN